MLPFSIEYLLRFAGRQSIPKAKARQRGERGKDKKPRKLKGMKSGSRGQFCCPECGAFFTRCYNLSNHRITRHNVLPNPGNDVPKSRRGWRGQFACQDCSAVYTRSENLKKHRIREHDVSPVIEKTETGTAEEIRQFACPDCSAVYTRSANLKKHRIRQHEVSPVIEKTETGTAEEIAVETAKTATADKIEKTTAEDIAVEKIEKTATATAEETATAVEAGLPAPLVMKYVVGDEIVMGAGNQSPKTEIAQMEKLLSTLPTLKAKMNYKIDCGKKEIVMGSNKSVKAEHQVLHHAPCVLNRSAPINNNNNNNNTGDNATVHWEVYSCAFCPKKYFIKNSLYQHRSRAHCRQIQR